MIGRLREITQSFPHFFTEPLVGQLIGEDFLNDERNYYPISSNSIVDVFRTSVIEFRMQRRQFPMKKMLFLLLLVLFLVPAMAFAGADIKDETLPG